MAMGTEGRKVEFHPCFHERPNGPNLQKDRHCLGSGLQVVFADSTFLLCADTVFNMCTDVGMPGGLLRILYVGFCGKYGCSIISRHRYTVLQFFEGCLSLKSGGF